MRWPAGTTVSGCWRRWSGSNLFVVALDDERRWYRYHHLFAEALRARLHAQNPGHVGDLHRAAARWYASEGMITDALPHALAGDDPSLAADLVELGLPELSRQRQDRTLRDWLASLPTEEKRRRPVLATAHAWACLSRGDVDAVEPWLDAAETELGQGPVAPLELALSPRLADMAAAREAEARGLPSMIAVYRAAVAQARGDIEQTVAHAERALALAAADDHASRAAAAGFLGLAAWAAGDLVTAVDTFTEAVGSLHAAGKLTDELGSTVVLGQMWLARGRPAEARMLYERALKAAERYQGPPLSTLGDLHVGLADVLREQGLLGAAEEHLQAAKELGDRGSLPENRHRWYAVQAGLAKARGDLGAAVTMLDQAEPLYVPGYFPDVRPVSATRARVRILQGRSEEAWAWVRERGVGLTDAATYLAEYDQLTFARLLVADGRAPEAIEMLGRRPARRTRRRPPGQCCRGAGGAGARLRRRRRAGAGCRRPRGRARRRRAGRLLSAFPRRGTGHDGTPRKDRRDGRPGGRHTSRSSFWPAGEARSDPLRRHQRPAQQDRNSASASWRYCDSSTPSSADRRSLGRCSSR